MTIIESARRETGGAGPGRDDVAYILPMGVFLALTWAGGHWPGFFVASYVIKTLAAGALLIAFRRSYTRVRWTYWWVGILVGVVGIVQWVGMEELLRAYWPNYPRIPGAADPMNPFTALSTPTRAWAFVVLRWLDAALVVPFMEELFWRDFLWRTIIAPNDFHLAEVGEWDWKAFVFVALVFASVHPMWMTAIVWGVMIGGMLVVTRSLGACIIAHAVTNFLLGAYVLWTGRWYYW